MLASLEPFAALYAHRPIRDNRGGMAAPHAFLTWFALRALRPEVVIESGVFRGQSTWLIEQALPGARIVCIEPRPGAIEYRSPRARYERRDFRDLDLGELPPEGTVAFFDDHQNAVERIEQCARRGLRHLLFEDNYPPGRGDCYSLKMAFAGAGFSPPPDGAPAPRRWLRRMLGRGPATVAPNEDDARMLRERLEVYAELPPVFRTPQTRFGDPWDARLPTPPPLLEAPEHRWQRIFLEDAQSYTWLAYARLR